MSISVVNGYVCTSCSDVAKAKQGENPHPPPGTEDSKNGEGGADSTSPFDGPAVTFGGTLGAFSAYAIDPARAVRSSSEPSQRTTSHAVDLLV